MTQQGADEIAQSASGEFNPEQITQTDSVSTPLIAQLSDDEQLHYLLYNVNKGFRIWDSDGEEHTPHHSWSAWGKRFLLITDRRVLYVVGQKEEDVVQTFNYEEIEAVDADTGWVSRQIRFATQDNKYKFAGPSLPTDIEAVAEYMRTQIQNNVVSSRAGNGDGTGTAERDGSNTATLTDLTGVGEAKAEQLREAGYTSVERIRGVDQDTLSKVDGIGSALAARIKATTGATPTERPVDTDDTARVSEASIEAFKADIPDTPAGSRDADTFEAQAQGDVSGKELTATGGEIFRVGYFDMPVAVRIDRSETVQYVLRNYVDGLTHTKFEPTETIEPADNRRAVACVTDQRLLFVIGGAGRDDADKSFSVPLDQIIAAGSGDGVLRVVALSESLKSKSFRFPVTNPGELPAAVEYLSGHADLSVLDQQVEKVNTAASNAQEYLTSDQHNKAHEAVKQGLAAHGQYATAVNAITTSSSGRQETKPSLDLPQPDLSRAELKTLQEAITADRWEQAYQKQYQAAKDRLEKATSRPADDDERISLYRTAAEKFEAAHKIATEHDVGEPDTVEQQVFSAYEAIHDTYRARAEGLRAEAEQQSQEEMQKAIETYTEVISLLQEADAVPVDTGDPDAVARQIAEAREARDDAQIYRLGQQVSEVSVPEATDEPVGATEFDSTISTLESVLSKTDNIDISRPDDLELIKEEARRKLGRAQLGREQYRAEAAVEQFANDDYTAARGSFETVTDNLRQLATEGADERLADRDPEIRALTEVCEENANVARKAALGLADESDLQPVRAETTEPSPGSETPTEHPKSGDNLQPFVDGTEVGLKGAVDDTLSLKRDVAYEDFEKLDQIGSGGNADVFRATVAGDNSDRTIAVKEPRMQGTVQTDDIDRFISEAETWSKLDSHSHIATVFAYDSTPLPWIALEYMDRGDLTEQQPRLAQDEKFRIAVQVTDAVWHAHQRGIAHLDLKPQNILFKSASDDRSSEPVPKVADWGLSKMLLNHSASVEGFSPQYSAPEQFDSETYGTPDQQTDIYQLGVIFYELFTDRHPFRGPPSQVMHAVLNESPVRPSEQTSGLPEGVDNILLKTLSKEKSDRYEAAVYLRDALSKLSSHS